MLSQSLSRLLKCAAGLLLIAFPVSQADACHAYQIVHKNGIPDEQIVVMMYDDLAENEKWVDIFVSLSYRDFFFPLKSSKNPL